MPIVDVELVCKSEVEFGAVSARALADAPSGVLRSQPGHTWVRLRVLSGACYAENHVVVAEPEFPVFVTVLHGRPPVEPALAAEVAAITEAVAHSVGRPRAFVHVQYAPAAVGRQAFGGQLVQ